MLGLVLFAQVQFLVDSFQCVPFGQGMHVLFPRTKIGRSMGHCQQIPPCPLMTQGVQISHCVVFQFETIQNLSTQYFSIVMLPKIQLFASRLVTLMNQLVSISVPFTSEEDSFDLLGVVELMFQHWFVELLKYQPGAHPTHVSLARTKIGFAGGHCSHVVLPLRTQGVWMGHKVVLCFLVISNRLRSYQSAVMFPMIQLLASRLVTLTKSVVSARGALEGGREGFGSLTFVAVVFSHWLVQLLKCYPTAHPTHVSLAKTKIGVAEGHCSHVVFPFRTQGVWIGHNVVLCFFEIQNLLTLYSSIVMFPIIQLLASRLLTLTKLVVSASGELEGENKSGLGGALTFVPFLFSHWFVELLKYQSCPHPTQVSLARTKIGFAGGHCSHVVLPLRTQGVWMGHKVVLCFLVISNLLALYQSTVMFPMIQLLASRLVTLTKPVVSARGALEGLGKVDFYVLTLVAFMFQHCFVQLLKCYPFAQSTQVSLYSEKTGVAGGHCSQADFPLSTYGVAEGQRDVFWLLVIRNLFCKYSSIDNYPKTQLFASRLVTLAKPAVSARGAMTRGEFFDDGLEGFVDWSMFSH